MLVISLIQNEQSVVSKPYQARLNPPNPKYNYEEELKKQLPQNIPLSDKERPPNRMQSMNKESSPSFHPNFMTTQNSIPPTLPIYLVQQQQHKPVHAYPTSGIQLHANQNPPSYNQPLVNSYHNNPSYSGIQSYSPIQTRQPQVQAYNAPPHNYQNPASNYQSNQINPQIQSQVPQMHPQQVYSNPHNAQPAPFRGQYMTNTSNDNMMNPSAQYQQNMQPQQFQHSTANYPRPSASQTDFPNYHQGIAHNRHNTQTPNYVNNNPPTQYPLTAPNLETQNRGLSGQYYAQNQYQNPRQPQLPSYLQNPVHQQPQIVNQAPPQTFPQYNGAQNIQLHQGQPHQSMTNNQQIYHQQPVNAQLAVNQPYNNSYASMNNYNSIPPTNPPNLTHIEPNPVKANIQTYYYQDKGNNASPQIPGNSNDATKQEDSTVNPTLTKDSDHQSAPIGTNTTNIDRNDNVTEIKDDSPGKRPQILNPAEVTKIDNIKGSTTQIDPEPVMGLPVETTSIEAMQPDDQNTQVLLPPPPPEGKCPELPKKKALTFFLDTTPIGAVTNTDDAASKKFESVKKLEPDEKQYRIIGHDRWFRTQEKNLLEKLQKFLVVPSDGKEEKKKEEKTLKEKEGLKKGDAECATAEEEVAGEEFNFDSRYFMYNPTQVCNRCKKPGHFEKWCTDDVVIKCMFCLGQHRMDECTQIVCFSCYGVGHRIRECKIQDTMTCYRCGKRGHRNTQCGVLMSKDRELLKREKRDYNISTKCVACNNYGHANCKTNNLFVFGGSYFDDMYAEEDYADNPSYEHDESLDDKNSLKRQNSSLSFPDSDELNHGLISKKLKVSPEGKGSKGK